MEGKILNRKTTQPQSSNLRPRVSTARPMIKSKTTAEILRPLSGRTKEFYTLSRLMPNIIKEDKELLFEDNMRLKDLSNKILEDNLHLKTRVKKLEMRKRKIENKDPTLSLISSLKEKIKELNDKLNEKDEENQSLRRNIKTCKLEENEIETQELEEECKRLKNHLSEFMKQKEIPISHLDYESRLYNKAKVVSKLKKELLNAQDDLYRAKEDLGNMKEKLQQMEKRNRKSSPKNQETNYLKEEIEALKDQNAQLYAEFYKKEEDFRLEIRNLKETVEKDNQRYKNLEKDHEEKQMKISILEKQMNYLKSQNYKSHETLIPKALIPNEEKSKHPPRLFLKIWQIAKKKNMLISVFLSLLDKNNNGSIEAEELCKGINFHGKFIKKKHVNEILRLMNSTGNTIPIRTLEQLIEKYEYEEEYVSSSEEEKVEPVKPRAERLKFKAVNLDPKMNDVLIPQNFPAPPKFKEPEIQLVRPEELSNVFERIRLQMIEKMVNKNRCVNLLFGNYLDPEAVVNVTEVIEYLHSGGIFLGDQEETLRFGKFLIEPADLTTLKESDYKVIKNKLNDFSKKLNKSLPDWSVIDRYKQHLIVFPILGKNKHHFISELQKLCSEPGLVPLESFNQILPQYGIHDSSSLTHLYLLSFAACKEVFKISVQGLFDELEKMQGKIFDLKKKHERLLKNVASQLEKNRLTFEAVFSYEREISVNIESFTSALKSIEVVAEDELVNDIRVGKYYCHLGLMKALLVNQE